MDITIVKAFPIGIKEQVTRQIKLLIKEGRLKQGDMLLSAKDLARYLGIHQNTVAAIYKELENQNLVSIVKGSGTFVAKASQEDQSELKQIFQTAYNQALESGFSQQSILDSFITGLLENSKAHQKGKKALLVDYNYSFLSELDKQLKEKLDIDSHFMLINDIQTLPGRFLKRARTCDLVLCNINVLNDLKTSAPDIPIETIGFTPRTSAGVIQQLLRLSPGTCAGFCCTSRQSAHSFFTGVIHSDDDSVQKIYAGINDMGQISKMVKACDIIFATHFVHELLVKQIGPTIKTIRVPVKIDPEHFDFITSKLTKGCRP